jgi:hypothetical protein
VDPITYRKLKFDVGSFGLTTIFLEEGSGQRYLGVAELKNLTLNSLKWKIR